MPAKLLGQLVGGPVNGLRTGVFAGLAPPHCKDSADQIMARDYVTLAGALIGDQVSLGEFRSTAFLDMFGCRVLYDDLGAGCTCTLGDAVHPAAFGVPLVLTPGPSWRFFAVSGSDWTAQQIAWPLWQRLGYAADPGGRLELLATFAGANPANAGFGWTIYGRDI